MPLKSRRTKHRRTDPATPLSPTLATILLEGFAAELPAPEAGEDPFVLFDLSPAAWQDLWYRHKRELLAEWHRRGMTMPCWAEGEYEGKAGAYAANQWLARVQAQLAEEKARRAAMHAELMDTVGDDTTKQ